MAGHLMSTLDVGEHLGIRPRYTDSTMIGGSSFVSHLHHAALALSAGACDVALITYGSTMRSDSAARRGAAAAAGGGERPNYERAYGPRGPITGYALAAARHMHEFGTTREQLAEVAVAARQWAQLNPVAFKRDPADHRRRRRRPVISSPFGSLDCCLVTDGGGAAVIVPRPTGPGTCPDRRPTCSAQARPTTTSGSHRCPTSRPPPPGVGGAGLRHGRARPERRRRGAALRRLHDQPDPVPGGHGLLREG